MLKPRVLAPESNSPAWLRTSRVAFHVSGMDVPARCETLATKLSRASEASSKRQSSIARSQLSR